MQRHIAGELKPRVLSVHIYCIGNIEKKSACATFFNNRNKLINSK